MVCFSGYQCETQINKLLFFRGWEEAESDFVPLLAKLKKYKVSIFVGSNGRIVYLYFRSSKTQCPYSVGNNAEGWCWFHGGSPFIEVNRALDITATKASQSLGEVRHLQYLQNLRTILTWCCNVSQREFLGFFCKISQCTYPLFLTKISRIFEKYLTTTQVEFWLLLFLRM